jgi:hypothetical protein
MSFPWPVDELILNNALDIAMRYIDLPPDEEQYASVESFAREAIMADWRRGVRDRVVLGFAEGTAERRCRRPPIGFGRAVTHRASRRSSLEECHCRSPLVQRNIQEPARKLLSR